MSENKGQSGSTEAPQESTHGVSELDPKMNDQLKKMRAQLRSKITRTVNRGKTFIHQGAEMRKGIEKEMIQIHEDFELARECHAEMLEYVQILAKETIGKIF